MVPAIQNPSTFCWYPNTEDFGKGGKTRQLKERSEQPEPFPVLLNSCHDLGQCQGSLCLGLVDALLIGFCSGPSRNVVNDLWEKRLEGIFGSWHLPVFSPSCFNCSEFANNGHRYILWLALKRGFGMGGSRQIPNLDKEPSQAIPAPKTGSELLPAPFSAMPEISDPPDALENNLITVTSTS